MLKSSESIHLMFESERLRAVQMKAQDEIWKESK